eukprot:CAMPEP_0204576984 /NCGR_PEP_ID=MMETSP0661-20131031/42090_1 /ASSEMBLY_ACC=CAM_ASM_000606 /TAXON_ID=109239 /ORGANISM="Alexandrium margalefi, Strain AMGDE01CS-322" /LENGTH=129 /DNA_ID=CAMNT_0051585783 /DNA_START=1 /DNA_END=386 /DNA_ORIENTATION=+
MEDAADSPIAGLSTSADGEDTPVELLARRLGEFADNDDYLGGFASTPRQGMQAAQDEKPSIPVRCEPSPAKTSEVYRGSIASASLAMPALSDLQEAPGMPAEHPSLPAGPSMRTLHSAMQRMSGAVPPT